MENCTYTFKMDNSKKGLAVEELVGMLTLMFIAVLLIFSFYLVNFFSESKKQEHVTTSFQNIDTGYNLIYFLMIPSAENKLNADLIEQAYLKNDYGQMKELPNKFFKDVYGEQSYDVIIGGKSINEVHFTSNPSSTEVQIPTTTKQALTIGLFVG